MGGEKKVWEGRRKDERGEGREMRREEREDENKTW